MSVGDPRKYWAYVLVYLYVYMSNVCSLRVGGAFVRIGRLARLVSGGAEGESGSHTQLSHGSGAQGEWLRRGCLAEVLGAFLFLFFARQP